MQVVVKQFSGLGNQLFQYAAGRYAAVHFHAELRVAAEQQHRAKSLGQFDRPLLLSHFCVEAKIAPATALDRLLFSRNARLQAVLTPLLRALKTEVLRETPAQEHHTPQFPQTPPQKLYLDGYWQTHSMAHAIRPRLLRELTLSAPATGRNLDTLRQIQQAEHPVSMHVRRGDYALLHGGRLVLPPAYYHQAIARLQRHASQPLFFVFSDDVAYARTVLPPGASAVFVEGNGDFCSHEDLRLMAACRSHIIANSSFSWWGAWLNPADSKLVIAPKHWSMTADSYHPELYPPGWLLLDTV